MPNPTFRRWTADDIAKLKNMAQGKYATAVQTRLKRRYADRRQSGPPATSTRFRYCGRRCRANGYSGISVRRRKHSQSKVTLIG
jgi:hypothetical protein